MSCENFTKKFDDYKKIRKQKKLFGTFGFRGVVNEGMGAEKARRTGAALAVYLGEGKTIAIGKDPRISSQSWPITEFLMWRRRTWLISTILRER